MRGDCLISSSIICVVMVVIEGPIGKVACKGIFDGWQVEMANAVTLHMKGSVEFLSSSCTLDVCSSGTCV